MDAKNEKSPDEMSALEARLSRWHQAHPDATFTDMENAVDVELTRLRRELLGGLAVERETSEPQSCPACGWQMVRNGRKQRQVRTKDNEVLTVVRVQWRCLECGMTLFPPG